MHMSYNLWATLTCSAVVKAASWSQCPELGAESGLGIAPMVWKRPETPALLQVGVEMTRMQLLEMIKCDANTMNTK